MSLSVFHVVLHFHWDAVNGSCHCLSTANCKLKLGELLTVKTVPIVLSLSFWSFYCCLARFQIIATGNIDNMFVFPAWALVKEGAGRRGVDVSKLVSLSKKNNKMG